VSKAIYPYIGRVSAGFPSPADDYRENEIDITQYLQANPTATYFAKACGESMIHSHIPNDALLVVNKSIKPVNNSIVIATVNGENVVKHFIKTHAGVFLAPNNPAYKPLKITDDMDFSIWGVVTHVIIDVRR
jgi:DNA polymerase V